MKNSAFWKTVLREGKDKQEMGKRYLQIINLKEDLFQQRKIIENQTNF